MALAFSLVATGAAIRKILPPVNPISPLRAAGAIVKQKKTAHRKVGGIVNRLVEGGPKLARPPVQDRAEGINLGLTKVQA